jgi:hypothetical protein
MKQSSKKRARDQATDPAACSLSVADAIGKTGDDFLHIPVRTQMAEREARLVV